MGWVLLAIVVVGGVVIWRLARRRSRGAGVLDNPLAGNLDRGYADMEAQTRRMGQGNQGGGGYGF
jgi:hypothetical protein